MNPFHEVEITIEHADQSVRIIGEEGQWMLSVRDNTSGRVAQTQVSNHELASVLFIYGACDDETLGDTLPEHYKIAEPVMERLDVQRDGITEPRNCYRFIP